MASPESNQQQQTWAPYESAKDCSQSFCSVYCPQWCHIIFPPPSPFSYAGDDDGDDSTGGSTNFSPFIIALVGILTSAFVLISYYTIISKYCSRHSRHHRRDDLTPNHPALGDNEDNGNQSHRHETWHASPSNGLDEALISKILVYKYRRSEGLVDGTDCSVCLSEFREDESLRLLPKCSHAFHQHCIDTWLRSHTNCPLCRADIVSVNPVSLPHLPAPSLSSLETSHHPVAEGEREGNDVMVMVIEDLAGETNSERDGGRLKEAQEDREDNHDDIIEIRDDEGVQQFRRSLPMDSQCRGPISVANILQLSIKDEFREAKFKGLLVGGGSLSRARGESSKGSSRSRSLNCPG